MSSCSFWRQSSIVGVSCVEVDMPSVSLINESIISAQNGLFSLVNGSKIFCASGSALYRYDLSTNWQLSTASFVASGGYNGYTARSPVFNPDGTKLFQSSDGVSGVAARIKQFTTSAAYNMDKWSSFATASATLVFDLAAGIVYYAISRDGTKLYAIETARKIVVLWTLTTPWSLAALTSQGVVIDFSARTSSSNGLGLSQDGTKLYLCTSTQDILVYTLSSNTATYQETITLPFTTRIPSSFEVNADNNIVLSGALNIGRIAQFSF